MNSNLFLNTIKKENFSRPPVWFMRQAGRYHSHYQKLRARYSFMDLCKLPEIAAEVTFGPIQDFDFDAAILFSDLLFPLEAMGMGLSYTPGPKLDWYLRDLADLKRLRGGANLINQLHFQAEALHRIRRNLSPEKGLLGFVGGPLTLFYYAVEGSHQGELKSAKPGLTDGRYTGFIEKLMDLLAANMVLQAEAGADTIAILDTCAGELTPEEYKIHGVPVLKELMRRFRERCPSTPITYYSKGTGPAHWKAIQDLPISCFGIDWNHELADVLTQWSDHWAIQGNFDPNQMLLPSKELEPLLLGYFEKVKKLPPSARRGWVCGLGHGVLPGTPEENVRFFIRLQREFFK